MSVDLTAEAILINRAKAGDQEAFTVLHQRYERQIYAFVYRQMGDADDAYDLTQDTFVKAYKAIVRTNDTLNFAAWLHRIATNACLDVLRRRQRIRWLPWDTHKHEQMLVSAPIDDPERSALSQETRASVQRVLNRMSHRHRLALVLREYEGLSCQEIGEVMHLSRSAVKSMLFRARDEFRRVYCMTEAPVAPAARGVA